MVGTSVRESRNDHAMAKHNRNGHRHEQKARNALRKNIGTKTMQMHSSETNAGVAIWVAPSMMAVSTSLPCSRWQVNAFDSDCSVIDKNADGKCEAAKSHNIECFAERRKANDRTEYGQWNGYGDNQR